MKFALSMLVAGVLASSQALAAGWERPEVLAVSKICGSLVKKKTAYDGVQAVFTQTGRDGKGIQSYYLAAVGAPAQSVVSELKEDEAQKVCVVGLPSTLAANTVLVDSPNTFLTLQVVR